MLAVQLTLIIAKESEEEYVTSLSFRQHFKTPVFDYRKTQIVWLFKLIALAVI